MLQMQARLSHASSCVVRNSANHVGATFSLRPSLSHYHTTILSLSSLQLRHSCDLVIMLKSTYRPAVAQPGPADSPLPPGWTEHKAPTGHTYYYNASTQQSTYTRPAPPLDDPLQIDYGATEPDQVMRASMQVMDQFNQNATPQSGHFTGGKSYQDHSRRRGTQGDRPKHKAPIPDCAPWVLVKTKLGRRFVHNTETKQSLWKFPQDVMMKVIDMDRMEWEAKKRKEEADTEQISADPEKPQTRPDDKEVGSSVASRPPVATNDPGGYDSDSYEEVEVTDDEGDEGGDEPSKRPRLTDQEGDVPPSGPVEFNEDDIAWQLAEMEGEADLADYENPDPELGEDEDEDEGLPLTDQDNLALFRSLLDHSGISPYSTFERLIEDHRIVEDERYVSLPTVSARKEAFTEWSKDRIAELVTLKQEQSEQSKKRRDPKVDYLRFLHNNVIPKLYWPEFKRKFKKAPEMTDRNLQDKDREKLYRDLVSKLKLPEPDRNRELVGLLKDTAKKEKGIFSKGMLLDELPDGILRDVRFYILDSGRRDELVQTFLETS